jgi:glycosyltransferase involved in cell wall biosynthesis
MRITVAICTWNRADLLDKTLAQLSVADRPLEHELEVLVVSNNCTDHTDEVVARHQARLPIRPVWQKMPGLSNARNAAIDVATGDFIVWTDDDVLVDADWMRAYERAIRRYPEAGFFGGPIDPWFEGEPPAWIPAAWSRIHVAFAARDFGREDFELDPKRPPFGANFAVRTDLQRLVRYDPRLGRAPGSMQGGEEVAVLRELMSRGFRGWWIGDARVKHWIPRTRQTRAYLRSYYEGHGEQALDRRTPTGRFNLFSVPTWLWRAWLVGECRLLLHWLLRQHSDWGHRAAKVSVMRGMIRGMRRVATSARHASADGDQAD